MSDISKINPNGTEYNLKDAIARTNMGNLSNLETTEKTDLVSAVNEVKSGLTKIYHGTVTTDDTYGIVTVPNATNSLIVLLGNASTLYHLDYNNPNVFILRDSNNYPVINTSVEIMAMYI